MPDDTNTTSHLEGKIDGLATRVGDLATACGVMGEKLDNVRLEQAGQAERWTAHFQSHKALDGRLDGLEDREREATKTGIKTQKASDPPSKKNGRWNGDRVKSYMMIGFFIGIGILTAVNTWSTPSTKDLERVAERADSVAAAVEKEIKPIREEKAEVKQDRETMRKILKTLEPLMMEVEP